jgi:hypothetical protein
MATQHPILYLGMHWLEVKLTTHFQPILRLGHMELYVHGPTCLHAYVTDVLYFNFYSRFLYNIQIMNLEIQLFSWKTVLTLRFHSPCNHFTLATN